MADTLRAVLHRCSQSTPIQERRSGDGWPSVYGCERGRLRGSTVTRIVDEYVYVGTRRICKLLTRRDLA